MRKARLGSPDPKSPVIPTGHKRERENQPQKGTKFTKLFCVFCAFLWLFLIFRNDENDFAGFNQLQFLAGEFFNSCWISAQRLDFGS